MELSIEDFKALLVELYLANREIGRLRAEVEQLAQKLREVTPDD